MPLDGTTAAVMADAGLHPFLELTLGTGKSLASVLRHLATKWAAAAAGVGSSLPYVHPPPTAPYRCAACAGAARTAAAR